MMSNKQFIEKIERDSGGQTPRLEKMLNNAIQSFVKNLNSSDVHYVFELLQNADDNEYDEDNSPDVDFDIKENT